MVIPSGVALAHLIPEEYVNSVSLVLRKAHLSGETKTRDPSRASPAAQTLPLGGVVVDGS